MYCHEFKYSFEFSSFPLLLPIDRALFSSTGCYLPWYCCFLSKNSTVLTFDVLKAKSPNSYETCIVMNLNILWNSFLSPYFFQLTARFSVPLAAACHGTAASYLKIAQFLPLGRAWLQK